MSRIRRTLYTAEMLSIFHRFGKDVDEWTLVYAKDVKHLMGVIDDLESQRDEAQAARARGVQAMSEQDVERVRNALMRDIDSLVAERDEAQEGRRRAIETCRYLHSEGLPLSQWHAKFCGAVPIVSALQEHVDAKENYDIMGMHVLRAVLSGNLSALGGGGSGFAVSFESAPVGAVGDGGEQVPGSGLRVPVSEGDPAVPGVREDEQQDGPGLAANLWAIAKGTAELGYLRLAKTRRASVK